MCGGHSLQAQEAERRAQGEGGGSAVGSVDSSGSDVDDGDSGGVALLLLPLLCCCVLQVVPVMMQWPLAGFTAH